MTKQEFKIRWESDEDGGGITFEDIAECAIAWGISSQPRTRPILTIRDQVLAAAGIKAEAAFEGGGPAENYFDTFSEY